MKTINVSFDDIEFDNLLEKKGEKVWRDWILYLAKVKKKEKANGMED